jgi:predicted oxidoreductase (fatty acid repression mutant protein)
MKIIHDKQHKIWNLSKSQTKNIMEGKNKTYSRIMNTTDTQFTHEQIKLLSKGLKYILHYRQKN